MSEVNGSIGWGFSDKDAAEYHLSAFNTIIEVMGMLAQNPQGIMDLFPNYFLEVVNEAVEKDVYPDYETAKKEAAEALVGLFAINQRLSYMMATEVAETIGGRLPSDRDMIDPIERHNANIPMTSEEVFEEAMRIMRNNHCDTTRKDQ